MIGNCGKSTEEDRRHSLSIEKACEEYNNSVKLTLEQINRQLDDVLLKNSNGLDELAMKIAARTNFLEKNPSFLSCLVYDKDCVKCEPLLAFDDIRITIKEHSKRIQEKLEEIEGYHNKLLQFVVDHGQVNLPLETDESFHDCSSEPEFPPESSPKEVEVTLPARAGFDKVIIAKNAYSEKDLSKDTPVNFHVFTDVVPNVERGKPQENLHEKFLKQVVASDSLEGFLKLMQRKPSRPRRAKTDLQKKYAGSLWFFSKDIKKAGSASSRKSSKSGNLLVSTSQPSPIANQQKKRRINLGLSKNMLKCYDLLDDIDHSDLMPIQAEYPRRDNLQAAKSYLHRMMDENEGVWKKLLQIPKNKTQKTRQTRSKKKKDAVTSEQRVSQNLIVMPVQVTYDKPQRVQKRQEMLDRLKELEKRNHDVQKNIQTTIDDLQIAINNTKHEKVKSLMDYLTAPEQKYLPQTPPNLIVMPVKVIYDNFSTTDKQPPCFPAIEDLSKKVEEKLLQTPPLSFQKRKQMLDQLKGLKMRNDNIQKNIQQAIDVIETKMIDLLSSPTKASNNAAFTAMEKEITQVLKMMDESQEKLEPEKDVASPKPKQSLKKREKSGSRIGDGEKKKSKDDSDLKRATKRNEKSCERKKTADIEEGERLLGQVDTVIKKIDRIYSRFYEEKPKKNEFESIAEVFEGIQKKTAVPQFQDYKYCEHTPLVTQTPVTFHQSHTYSIPLYQSVDSKPHLVGKTVEQRYDDTLQVFYSLFFSGVFVALNFDYVA